MELMMTKLEEGIVELYQLGWLYDEIANHLHVGIDTIDEVIETWLETAQREAGDPYDDSMDGDHASALASAGWGTDEDYGGGQDWDW